MSTTAEIRQQVGEDLGLVPIGQDLESQDQLRIDAAYTQTYERLKEKGLAAWPSAGPVPNKLVPYLCLLMEQRLLVSYSVPESRYVRINSESGPDGDQAMKKIAELIVQQYEPSSDEADF
jgi:hypothetical protein